MPFDKDKDESTLAYIRDDGNNCRRRLIYLKVIRGDGSCFRDKVISRSFCISQTFN